MWERSWRAQSPKCPGTKFVPRKGNRRLCSIMIERLETKRIPRTDSSVLLSSSSLFFSFLKKLIPGSAIVCPLLSVFERVEKHDKSPGQFSSSFMIVFRGVIGCARRRRLDCDLAACKPLG